MKFSRLSGGVAVIEGVTCMLNRMKLWRVWREANGVCNGRMLAALME
jgi:hypothetical protein